MRETIKEDLEGLNVKAKARVYQMLLDLRAVWLEEKHRIDAIDARLRKLEKQHKLTHKHKWLSWSWWRSTE